MTENKSNDGLMKGNTKHRKKLIKPDSSEHPDFIEIKWIAGQQQL